MRVLSAHAFAGVAGISERAAQKAFKNERWRGYPLPIIELPPGPGGASGCAWGVVVDAMHPELLTKFSLLSSTSKTPLQDLFSDGATEVATARACWRWSIICDVLKMPSGPERTAEINRITSRRHHFQGADVTICASTLYDWMNRYSQGGFGGLASGARADRGTGAVARRRGAG